MAKASTKRKADAPPAAASSSRSKASRLTSKKSKDVATAYEDDDGDGDGDEPSQEHGNESSPMSVEQDQEGRRPRATRATSKQPAVQIPAKTKETARIADKPVADEEPEEDFGRPDSSQQFLKLVELASRKKSEANEADDYLADFKKKVKEEQVELETFLEDKAHEVSKQNNTFHTAFQSSHSSAMLMFAPADDPNPSRKPDGKEPRNVVSQGNGLKDQSELVLKNASELIAAYERCEELIKTLGENAAAVGEDWQDRIDRAKRILEGGRLVGEKRVDSVMMGAEEAHDQAVAEGEMMGKELYGMEMVVASWDEIASRQEKVVRKMTRLLPDE